MSVLDDAKGLIDSAEQNLADVKTEVAVVGRWVIVAQLALVFLVLLLVIRFWPKKGD